MARDFNLHLESLLPVTGQSNITGALDLGVDTQAFSDQWRQGRLRVDIPALPNATNANASVTLTLQDTIDGVNFANCSPLCQITLPGVANSGIAAAELDMPLPPTLRGPIQVLQAVAANIGGDCSTALIEFWWVNE